MHRGLAEGGGVYRGDQFLGLGVPHLRISKCWRAAATWAESGWSSTSNSWKTSPSRLKSRAFKGVAIRCALDDCLDELPEQQRRLILERYGPGGSLREIAESLGRSPASLAVSLHRVRRVLMECVERKLADGSH